jgi:ABC-type uncharacterized transport system ATPase subunit
MRIAMPEASVAIAEPAPAIMRAEGVTLRFGGVTALSNVSINIQRSEIVAVIGPNGAGKSWESGAPSRGCSCFRV